MINHSFFSGNHHDLVKGLQKIEVKYDQNFILLTNIGYTYITFLFGEWSIDSDKLKGKKLPNNFFMFCDEMVSLKGLKGSFMVNALLPVQTPFILSNEQSALEKGFVDLSEFIPNSLLKEFRAEIKPESTFNEIYDAIEKYFGFFLHKLSFHTNSSDITDYILDNNGLLCKEDILSKFQIKERTLERMFMKEVGCSPHKFIKHVRFHSFRNRLNDKVDTIKDLIEEYNYYDRSHLDREFRSITDMNLKEYRSNKKKFLIA